MKIYIQILANKQVLGTGSMQLRDYAEYILNIEDRMFPKSDINSKYFLDIYNSWERNNLITFSFMKDNFLKRVEKEDYLTVCNKGRLAIRSAGNSPFLFAAPFLDKLDHSFDPNCEFDMIYLPHLRSPFIRIRVIKNIK